MSTIVSNIFVTFYVFESHSNFLKKFDFSCNLLYPSKNLSRSKLKRLQILGVELSEMIGKVAIQVRQNLALLCSLVFLILSWKCVKSIIMIKIVPKTTLGGAWGKLQAGNCVRRQSWTKYMRQTLVLMSNNTVRESFALFSASFKKCFD